MDKLSCSLNKIINSVKDFDAECQKTIADTLSELDEFLAQSKSNNSKKAKRLAPISDVAFEDSLASTESRDTQNATTMDSILENSQQSRRPTRAAKLKVLENLREKPLNTKLRRPSNDIDCNSTQQNATLNIKREKLSEINKKGNKDKQQQNSEKNQQDGPQEEPLQQQENAIVNGEKRKSDEIPNNENTKKVDNSLEIVINNDSPIVELLSEDDDDDVDKMPPPTILPPKKRMNRKNQKTKDDSSTDVPVYKPLESLKVEKSSLDNNNKVLSPNSTTQEVDAQSGKIKNEKESIGSKKGKKGRKAIKHKPIKEEKIKNDEDKCSSSDKNKDKEITSSQEAGDDNVAIEVRRSTRNTSKKKQASGDSLYEDAVTDQVNKNSDKKNNSNNKNGSNQSIEETGNRKDSNESNKSSKQLVVKVSKLKLPSTPVGIGAKSTNSLASSSTITLSKNTVDPSPEKPTDATFVSAISDIEEKSASNGNNEIRPDATFITNADVPTKAAAQETFIVNKNHPQNDMKTSKANKNFTSNETQVTTSSNETFCIDKETNGIPEPLEKKTNGKNVIHNDDEVSQNSLLTEDESHDDEADDEEELQEKVISKQTLPKMKPKLKHKNELFSPFIQSPVKKKVEAFEKHANKIAAMTEDTASPIPQRQTRTKTRLKQQQQQQNEKDQETESEPTAAKESNHKAVTPLHALRLGRVLSVLTPTQQSNITPTQTNTYKKPLPSSTSKLHTLQKTASLTSIASSKGSSLSQENCIDKLQSKTKLNQLVEEKKKLREMKTQLVLKTKEAKDKERQERIKKQLEEKAEKARKAEAEKRKHLEEIQKNMKIFEEAQRKLEKQKQLESEKSDLAARKEREIQEKIFKNKEQMKLKYQQNQLQIQQQLLQQQQQLHHHHQQHHHHHNNVKKNNITPVQQKLRYDFEMLNSDDSTDDEGKTSAKRPQPPVWSKSSVRHFHIERQTYLPTKIIDSFFSVQPTTPNLKEIFPSIDPRYLKRNSSMVWKTPPRYSQLPKY